MSLMAPRKLSFALFHRNIFSGRGFFHNLHNHITSGYMMLHFKNNWPACTRPLRPQRSIATFETWCRRL